MPGNAREIRILEARAGYLEKNNKELVNLIQQLVNLIGIMNMDIIDLRSRVIELEKDRKSG